MKKKVSAALISAALVLSCSSCGKTDEGTNADNLSSESATTTAATSVSEKKSETTSSQAEKNICAEEKVGTNGNDTVSKVRLIPKEKIDISQTTRFRDLYGKNALHTGVVGLVGAPISVSYNLAIKNPTLEFTYNPDKLHGVRPDALMFLWYNENANNYEELSGEKLDKKNCTVSIDINKQGDYMLVNKYQWLSCWGVKTDDNGMESDYKSTEDFNEEKWKKNAYTGDIINIADKEYIKKCVQQNGDAFFSVTNAVELASAVYYVNCANDNYSGGRPDVEIDVINDIDLSGIAWAPMGWSDAGNDYRFKGDVRGNGYTIKNMTINGNHDSGFVGESYSCQIIDLNFQNADVRGLDSGIILGNDIGSVVSGCKCQGKTTGAHAGSIAGQATNTDFLRDCSANVIVNGKKETKYLSYSQKQSSEVEKSVPKTVKITVDKNYVVKRPSGIKNYKSLTWHVKTGTQTLLKRNAENETEFHVHDFFKEKGKYSVTLEAFINGYYVPISNTVNFKIK